LAARPSFYIVQPYGRDKERESTVVAECESAEAAFAEIDRLAEQMHRTGARPDQIELLVVNERREIVRRKVQ
jgi:hypothetical protein